MRRGVILKLNPNTRFHFGKSLADSNVSLNDTDLYLHSDVLFSALVNNLSTVKSETEVTAFVEAFRKGVVKVSSGFYCLENKQKEQQERFTYFIPKPVDKTNQVSIEDDYKKIKILKKVLLITPELLSQPYNNWQCNKSIAVDEAFKNKLGLSKLPELVKKGTSIQVGLRNMKTEENENDILEQQAGPYSVSYIQIMDLNKLGLEVHFYFIYELLDETYRADLELAIKLIQFNGLGGERSSGYGEVKGIEFLSEIPDFFTNKSNQQYLALSKIIPKDSVELQSFSAYTHSVRGGRKTNIFSYLKSIRMINEGAVLKKPIEGAVVSLSDKATYLRNGKAFLIAVPKK